MKFKLYRQYGALNSPPIFDALTAGLKYHGHSIVDNGEDIAVIWSVLFSGRMARNKEVYQQARLLKKPVLIIEVGNLKRGHTWRLGLNHTIASGDFGNDTDLDLSRPSRLGISLQDCKLHRRPEIIIATQHTKSLQWHGQPSMESWVEKTVDEFKAHTDRPILIRPHPRTLLALDSRKYTIQKPIKINGTYDDFDIDYNYHCVVNFNSGPAVQASVAGVPVICDKSSLAGELSNHINSIENLQIPDREQWFLKLCHTEWTVDEIKKGIPIMRLKKSFENYCV